MLTEVRDCDTINIPMLQTLMPRFAQGPPTLDLDFYSSLDP